jgi:hypothetical protein
MDIFNNPSGITKPNYALETEVGKIVGLAPTIIEIVVLVLMLFYIFFAFILTRRVKIMNTNFKTPAAPSFSLLASINLLASLVVIVITLLTLIK